MDFQTERKIAAILQILHESQQPLGATKIAGKLPLFGINWSQRTVRHYLAEMDRRGLTINLGRRGRQLTSQGEQELRRGLVIDKVGFVAAKVDALAYRMTFSLRRGEGDIILNLSTVASRDLPGAVELMLAAYEAGLSMGQNVVIRREGEMLGDFRVPEGRTAIGTVCSVMINGVFLAHGIATVSRFGGLLELQDGKPRRFTEIIHYEGTTLDPLEVFIKGRMTSVGEAARTGNGVIGASFREVPAAATEEVERIARRLDRLGLGGIILLGRPNQPLLGIPVLQGRTGLIVVGGLNPLGAVEEQGIETENMAMGTLFPFEHLHHYDSLRALGPP